MTPSFLSYHSQSYLEGYDERDRLLRARQRHNPSLLMLSSIDFQVRRIQGTLSYVRTNWARALGGGCVDVRCLLRRQGGRRANTAASANASEVQVQVHVPKECSFLIPSSASYPNRIDLVSPPSHISRNSSRRSITGPIVRNPHHTANSPPTPCPLSVYLTQLDSVARGICARCIHIHPLPLLPPKQTGSFINHDSHHRGTATKALTCT